jgi:hypothetical protein
MYAITRHKAEMKRAVPTWEGAQRQAREHLGDEGITFLNKAAKKLKMLHVDD